MALFTDTEHRRFARMESQLIKDKNYVELWAFWRSKRRLYLSRLTECVR